MRMNRTRKTPIGAILYITYIDSGLSLPDFVAEIGYRNLQKGIRTFQSFVNTGTGNFVLIERLQESRFALDPEILIAALTETERQIFTEREAERERLDREREHAFRPLICAVPKLDPGAQIILFAITNDFESYTTQLPSSIASWELQKQYEYVQVKIRESYRKTDGTVLLLGPIVSYLYYRRWNEPPISFSIDGQLLGAAPRKTPPNVELRVRNTPIRRKLLAQFLCSKDERTLN